MNDSSFVKQSLCLQGLPAYDNDIHHILSILNTIHHAESSFKVSPNLTVPLTVPEKRLLLWKT